MRQNGALAADHARLEELAARSLQRGPERAWLRGVDVVAGDALLDVDRLPALGEGIGRRLLRGRTREEEDEHGPPG